MDESDGSNDKLNAFIQHNERPHQAVEARLDGLTTVMRDNEIAGTLLCGRKTAYGSRGRDWPQSSESTQPHEGEVGESAKNSRGSKVFPIAIPNL